MKTNLSPDTITPQYIVDEKGRRTGVILDIKLFEAMLEELEDIYDVAEAEKIIKKGEKGYTHEEVKKSLLEED